MAWTIDTNTCAVTMHRGDTGAYYVTFEGSEGAYEDGDTAIYMVKQGQEELIYKEYNLNPATPNSYECGDGKILVAFQNSTTDTWAAGSYSTEFRVARNPKRDLKVALKVTSEEAEPITAAIDEDTCLAYVTTDTGTVTLTYTTEWSASPASYGITVTGTPVNGDQITVSWNKNGTGRVMDGDNVRTVIKSSITIQDVLIEI